MKINVICGFNTTYSSSSEREKLKFYQKFYFLISKIACYFAAQGKLKGKQRRKTFGW